MIILSQERDFIEPWHHLSATVLDDSTDPFRKAHGESLFQYTSHNPRVAKIFNAAMAHHSRLYMQAVLRAYYGFQDAKCLVDVGGGTGSSLPSTRTFEESIMIYPMSSQPRLPIQVLLDHVLPSRHLVDRELVCDLNIRPELQPLITANF
jgi:hypothetical protein